MSRQNVYRVTSSTKQRRAILRSDIEQQRVSSKVWIRRLQDRARRCKDHEHKARLLSDIEYLHKQKPKRSVGYAGMEENEPQPEEQEDEQEMGMPASPPVLRRSDHYESDSDSDSDSESDDDAQASS